MARWTKQQLTTLKAMYAACHSYVDIAAALGVSKNAVAGQISRIRARQKAKLKVAKLPRKRKRKDHKLRFKPIRPSPRGNPLFRDLIDEMNKQQVSRRDLCTKAGIAESVFDGWRRHAAPRIDLLEACFNVLGKTLKPVDIDE